MQTYTVPVVDLSKALYSIGVSSDDTPITWDSVCEAFDDVAPFGDVSYPLIPYARGWNYIERGMLTCGCNLDDIRLARSTYFSGRDVSDLYLNLGS